MLQFTANVATINTSLVQFSEVFGKQLTQN